MENLELTQRRFAIFDRLKDHPSSFEELNQYFKRIGRGELALRTFQRDITKINEMFSVEIEYNRKENIYEITANVQDKNKLRIVQNLNVLNALRIADKAEPNLILDVRMPKGTEHLLGILYAIESKKVLEFTYKSSFFSSEVSQRKVEPIVLKEAQNRWYLICYDQDKKDFRTFALDRISNLEVLSKTFIPQKTDIVKRFEHAFGIENYENPQTIVLRCSAKQAEYNESLPLHHSQKRILESDGFVEYEYFIQPTNDFLMEIMKMGDEVAIMSPPDFRERAKQRIEQMTKLYK